MVLLKLSDNILRLMTYKMKMNWDSCIHQLSLSLEAKMPTYSLQCGPKYYNDTPNYLIERESCCDSSEEYV